jgi:hypothetical protein
LTIGHERKKTEWKKSAQPIPQTNIIRVIESRMIISVGHVAHIGKKINAYGILVEKTE